MEIVNLSMERQTYVKPTIAYVALEDACMRFTSWIASKDERVLPIVEEGDDGELPYDLKGAKAFDGWDFSDDDEDDIFENSVNVKFGSKLIK